MSFIPTNALTNLRCSNCAKYLSIFPIHSTLNGTSVCGRCPIQEDHFQNILYENTVEHQKFPCCYDSNGCTQNLFPKDMGKHEKLCTFKKLPCPFSVCQCEWSGFTKDLLEHFEAKHPTFILNEGLFEIDFINSHNEHYLLPYGEEVYIVNRQTDSRKNLFSCNVMYVGNNENYKNYHYILVLEDSNKSDRHELKKPIEERIEIPGDVIRNILNDPVSIVGRIEVIYEEPLVVEVPDEMSEQLPLNHELLKELECFVCFEYMIPPVYQCITGHSICYKCKEDVTECPVCNKLFENTVNFALAQIINHINYPCKYEKCKFVSKAKDIKTHEANCIYGPYKCPLNDYLACDAKLVFDDVYDHILNNHDENLLELEIVTLPFNPDENLDDCFIIRKSNKLFKLHYAYEHDEGNIYWSVQLIGSSNDSENYKYEIDVLDNSGSNCRMYSKKLCGPLTNKDQFCDELKYVVCVSYDIIKELITTEITFRVRVLLE